MSKKISELPQATAVNPTDELVIIQGGISKRATADKVDTTNSAKLGQWNIATNYLINDQVSYGGDVYTAKTNNIGKQPDSNPSDWEIFTAANQPVVAQWTGAQTYNLNDQASYNGEIYVSLQGSNTNKTPATEISWWKKSLNFSAQPQKTSFSASDLLLIEDVADNNKKKYITAGLITAELRALSLWDITFEYNNGDTTIYENAIYKSLQDNNTGNQPDTTSAYWQLQSIHPWNSAVTYQQYYCVNYQGDIYKSLQDTNLNQNPASQPTWWSKVDANIAAISRSIIAVASTDIDIKMGDAAGSNVVNFKNSADVIKAELTSGGNLTLQGSLDLKLGAVFESTMEGRFPKWTAAATYSTDDHVIHNGLFYRALQASSAQNPTTATAYWQQEIPFRVWRSDVTYVSSAYVFYQGTFYISQAGSNLNHTPGTDESWWLEANAYQARKLKSLSGNNIPVELADAAGATKFSIENTTPQEIFYVASNGNVYTLGTITATGNIIANNEILGKLVTWNSAKTYDTGDHVAVSDSGLIYVSLQDSNTNQNPQTETAYWKPYPDISSFTEKATPVSADLLLIEDSAASNAKKKIQIGNLPAAGAIVKYGIIKASTSTVGDYISVQDWQGTGPYTSNIQHGFTLSNKYKVFVAAIDEATDEGTIITPIYTSTSVIQIKSASNANLVIIMVA